MPALHPAADDELKKAVKTSRKAYELKEKARQYYEQNGVPDKMETILNTMFYDNPVDVYGHLANYFETFAQKPTIKKLTAMEVYDGQGQSTIRTQVYCTVKNHEKLITTSSMRNESHIKPEQSADRHTSLVAAINYINTTISDTFNDFAPSDQSKADSMLQVFLDNLQTASDAEKPAEETPTVVKPSTPEVTVAKPVSAKSGRKSGKKSKGGAPIILPPDELCEVMPIGCQAVCAVSQAVCLAASQLSDSPLYALIASLANEQVPATFKMPIPLITILAGGKLSTGKQRCIAEYLVLPQANMPLTESIRHIRGIYEYCASNLSLKAGAAGRLSAANGALCPPFERPEQGIELLQEAIIALGLTPGEDFQLAINCAASDILDQDKGRYEVVTGQWKSPDELCDFWADMLSKYTNVVLAIDPMRKQEYEAWMRLCERCSAHCYVCADRVLRSPSYIRRQPPAPPAPQWGSSASVIRMENSTTLSDVIAAAKVIRDGDQELIFSTSTAETNDTFTADLAVGLQVRFFKIGAPCRGEHMTKLNRLSEIETQLRANGQLDAWNVQHSFPDIRPPSADDLSNEPRASQTITPSKK